MNKIHKIYLSLFFITLTMFMVLNADAEEISVDKIVEKANMVAYYQGTDGRAMVKMDIKDSQGRIRIRQFTILRLDDKPPTQINDDSYCMDQKFYVYFHRPADVNKMAFMVWKKLSGDDNRWLYLPALDLVKRIASTEKRTSFVGSHFFYEDVSGRNINDDKHELLKTTENYYVLKNTPVKSDIVEFSYYTMWIHKKTFITVKAEYFDKNGEEYRTYEALNIETIDGYPTVTKAKMKDIASNGETEVTYNSVKYNIGLPEDIFTERYLRLSPVKYLRDR